jgi:hypothetical protein
MQCNPGEGAIRESDSVERAPHPNPLPAKGGRGRSDRATLRAGIVYYPATCLMRAISSSTALSTGTFSLTTRFMALAQTFSLLRMVNL